jgi:6-phosphogluconolactonase
MRGELEDLEEAAKRASDDLIAVAGSPAQIDFALVGVGEDGHIASVFGGGAGLEPAHRPIIAVHDAAKPPPRRLTMTLPVIASAARVVIAAFGAAKARVIDTALARADAATPVGVLLRRAGSLLVLLDTPHSH